MSEEPLAKFQEFALPEPLIRAIDDLGFERCTPIQDAVLPYSLANYDVTGQAQTGTGKTAAFLLTILTKHWEYPDERPRPPGTPRALVLAPTRELALQIEEDAVGLAKYMDASIMSAVGGIDFTRQQNRLERDSIDLLVATPGRLLDFCRRSIVNLGRAETLVIDEADRMLDMGFIPDVRNIVYKTPKKNIRQTLFFSATFNDDVMNLARQWTTDPEHVVIEPETVAADSVEQKFWLMSRADKAKILLKFVQQHKPNRMLVFVNRRDQARSLVSYLTGRGVECEALSGEIPQRKRMATLDRFKTGKIPYVVATDVAGRGIHVEGITHVVNFDLPEDPEDYVHRIGRTGRAGEEGISISFISEVDAFNLPAIEDYIGNKADCTQPDLVD